MEQVKWATAADMELLIRLRLDFLELSFRELTPEEKTSFAEELKKYYSVQLNQGNFRACYLNAENRVAATAFLVINHVPPGFSFPNGLSGTVLNVLTYPEFRKRGFATRLMEAVIEYARDNRLSHLELHATEMGMPLYEKLGFTPTPYSFMKLKL